MNKKIILIFLSLVLLFNIFPYPVLAINGDEGGLGEIFETIFGFFNWIPKYITLEKLMSGDERAVFIARLLVWIIIFSAVHFGLKFINSKGVRAAISFVVGVMGAALIPAEILTNIFQTYTIIGAVLVWCLPVLFGWYIMSKISKEHSFIRAFIYAVILFVLWNVNMTMDELTGAKYDSMKDWLGYFKILYLFAAIGFGNNLVRGFTGRGWSDRLPGASRASAGLRSGLPNMTDLWNRIRGGEVTDTQIDAYIGRLQGIESQLTTERTNLDSEEYRAEEQRNALVQRILNLQREFNEINRELARLGVM